MSEQSAGVVWDGTAWVDPASGLVWDGAGWALRGSPGSAPRPAGPAGGTPAISRGVVFGHVLWRVVIACVGGGAAIGLAFIGVLLAFPDEGGDGEAWSYLLVGPMVGGILGLFLSVVAAPLIAGVCAAALVPYPGASRTRLIARALGVGLVALFVPLLFAGVSPDVGVLVMVAAIWLAAVAGAWFASAWVVRWYIRRMEPREPTSSTVSPSSPSGPRAAPPPPPPPSPSGRTAF